jgi:hypothetical protein
MLITRQTIYIDEAVPQFDALQAPASSDLVGSGVFKRWPRTILVLAAVELQVRGMRDWTLELKRGGQDQDLARSVLR